MLNPQIAELRRLQCKISLEIIAIQDECEHEWKFTFEEDLTHNVDEFDSRTVRHYECEKCGRSRV